MTELEQPHSMESNLETDVNRYRTVKSIIYAVSTEYMHTIPKKAIIRIKDRSFFTDGKERPTFFSELSFFCLLHQIRNVYGLARFH